MKHQNLTNMYSTLDTNIRYKYSHIVINTKDSGLLGIIFT